MLNYQKWYAILLKVWIVQKGETSSGKVSTKCHSFAVWFLSFLWDHLITAAMEPIFNFSSTGLYCDNSGTGSKT